MACTTEPLLAHLTIFINSLSTFSQQADSTQLTVKKGATVSIPLNHPSLTSLLSGGGGSHQVVQISRSGTITSVGQQLPSGVTSTISMSNIVGLSKFYSTLPSQRLVW